MTDRELMQMALDTLSMAVEPKKGKVYAFEFQPIDCAAMYLKAIETLRARLAQPDGITLTNMRHPENLAVDEDADVNPDSLETIEIDLPEPEPQETIAKWIKANTEHRQWYICPKCNYQAPRFKDEWVGLTDEEIAEIGKIWLAGNRMLPFPLARAIEAKLKEKNT
jgi:hypothetical protein